MPPKQIDVTCPTCSTVLSIDVLTRKVLRRVAASDLDEAGRPKLDHSRWDSASQRVKSRSQESDGGLDDALRKERERRSSLDDRFQKAQEKLKNPPEEGPGDPDD